MDDSTTTAGRRFVTLDLTDDTSAAAAVARLDDQTSALLLKALRHHQERQAVRTILAHVRASLAEKRPDEVVLAVRFTSTEFDEGYYFTDTTAGIVYADGGTEYATFLFQDSPADGTLFDLMGEAFGQVTPDAVLIVNLRDEVIHGTRNLSTAAIHERLNQTTS